MKAFRTVLPKLIFPFSISHADYLLSMGSCFAVHIAERMQKAKFSIQSNPYGILFNPLSIHRGLEEIRADKYYEKQDLFYHNEGWHSFQHHGDFSASSPIQALDKINGSIQRARAQLKRTNRLLITFGTAYVWEHLETQQIVANCHKLPNQDFRRRLLRVEEIIEKFGLLFNALREDLPNLECLISVSPVRHIRDGLVNNQRSKATLILAAKELTEKFKYVHYFPAYELLMDDLRDYRFYGEDLIHPGPLGVAYVWEYFQNQFFTLSTQTNLEQINKLMKALTHRPLNPTSQAHQRFLKSTLDIIKKLEREIPVVSFEEEKNTLRKQIKKS